jgi:hypothetical protein
MNINEVRTYMPETKNAAILTFIGVLGSLLLKLFTIIGEASFVTLTIVSISVGLIIYFEKTIQSFKLGLTGIEATRKVELLAAKVTEPPPSIPFQTDDLPTGSFRSTLRAYGTDEDTKSVIKAIEALGLGPYTFRHVDGISQETGLPSESVIKALLWLAANNLAMETQGNQGAVWALTQEGRLLLSSIIATENASSNV